MASAKKTRNFNVLLDEEEYANLEVLSTEYKVTKGEILRQGLRYRFAQFKEGIYVCADGSRCLVPHLQGRPAAAAGGGK